MLVPICEKDFLGKRLLVTKLGGRRVGIIGLGSIGSRVSKRLEGFGCIISYLSRTKKSSIPYQYFSNIVDLASHNNILIVTCALTSETHHIVDKEVMSALGKEGVIINVGRGALIDEKEMVRCLIEGEIGGAGLDVFENEPFVPEELFEMDSVVLSAHRAAMSPEAVSDLLQVIVGNLEAFFANRPLLTPV
ncbi:uncharacterized protein A4U43_C04F22100 [Asparagus officinalis]|uniref:D-isomer specific 2-hydroxyacid dehydrogenase NAD-binding domain-containing protein n=1 Tax=Asparagus officinalis TaxID=4686 RepID=A0A5P1F7R2_ASPOF|nr:uncharacterized protein A4U43_C04F22100 [Asparagus officinalis]